MRNHSIFALTIIALLVVTAVEAKYSGGTGEPNAPYLIATAEDMNAIGANPSDWNKHFLLVADINLAEYTGTQFKIIGSYTKDFTGVFDGNGLKIWNFTWCGSPRIVGIGLFGFLGSGGQIKNLGLENVDVNYVEADTYWDYYIGGLVGFNDQGIITNCNMTGNVCSTSDNGDGVSLVIGGLVGKNDGTIIDSYSTASVSGSGNWSSHVGGLVGYNEYGTITNCHSIGSSVSGDSCPGGLVGGNQGVINSCYSSGSVSSSWFAGGLAGDNWHGTILNCYSTASVKGKKCVGGLAGENAYDMIINCYSTGSVSGDEDVGGLVGGNLVGATISNCYATGDVNGTGDYAGGLVGLNEHGTISNCYAMGSVSGDYYTGGLAGGNYTDSTIINCYSTGSVMGRSYVGGLMGYGNPIYVTASFWDVNTSGQTSSAGGTPKTTAEMKTRSTFTDAGWDFVCETVNGPNEVWTIDEGVDYPKLVWDVGCFPCGYKDYDDWLAAGKPPCWCHLRQCHGNADNASEDVKGKGYYYVHFKDMGQLLSAWNVREPPGGPGLKWPDLNICADFDHDKEYIKGKGYYRVHFKDMSILLANWNVKEPPDGLGIDPNCNCLGYCP